MFRNAEVAPQANAAKPLRVARLGMVLALPVLAPTVLLIDVLSVSLSPADVQSGSPSTGTVTLDKGPLSPVTVTLISSNSSVATVPGRITVSGKNGTGAFTVNTVSGAGGCATITAAVLGSGVKRATLLAVRPTNPPGPISMTLSAATVVGGSSVSGNLAVTPGSSVGQTVQLSSSNPAVTVPASVALRAAEIDAGVANFNIGTAVVQSTTCAIITATFQGSQNRALLKLTRITAG